MFVQVASQKIAIKEIDSQLFDLSPSPGNFLLWIYGLERQSASSCGLCGPRRAKGQIMSSGKSNTLGILTWKSYHKPEIRAPPLTATAKVQAFKEEAFKLSL